MSAQRVRSYRFETEAQWASCQRAQLDAVHDATGYALQPLSTFVPKDAYPSAGARTPAITRGDEIVWVADRTTQPSPARVVRMPAGFPQPYDVPASASFGRARRIVASPSGLWVGIASAASVALYEADMLGQRLQVPLGGVSLVDVAGDGHDGAFILVKDAALWKIVHVGCTGKVKHQATLTVRDPPTGFVYLKALQRFAVLSEDGREVDWFGLDGGAPIARLVVAGLRPCFNASDIARDAAGRLLLAGEDGLEPFGAFLLVLDSEGGRLQEIALQTRATGVAGGRSFMVVTTPAGLQRYDVSDVVPGDRIDVVAGLITPALRAPDASDGRRWLRVEATVSLPPGSSLELTAGATSDPRLVERMRALANDAALPPGHRAARLREMPGVWQQPVVFHGGAETVDLSVPLAAPLFHIADDYVWIGARLFASPGASLPRISRLEVIYPGRSLMDALPAIYRRTDRQPGDFLRGLVGVLEATSQQMDARIRTLGARIHPDTAPKEWLDYTAQWLGLPWHESLDLAQKRCIARHGAALAATRGTRAGLELLLGCIAPGTPRRYRVVDATADFGLATVAGLGCEGSRLPAILGGYAGPGPELGTRLILNATRLPCGNDADDDSSYLVGRLRVDVAATADERQRWSPWLESLIADMVPVSARMTVRWLPPDTFQDQDDIVLDGPRAPLLGTDSVTGKSYLPDNETPLTFPGTAIGGRLH